MQLRWRWPRFWLGATWAVLTDALGVVLLFATTWYIAAIVWVLLSLGFTGVPLVDDDWVLPVGYWTVQLLVWMAWLAGIWQLFIILGRATGGPVTGGG